MTIDPFLSMAGMIAVASAMPGPNILLTVTAAMKRGFWRAVPAILGNLACLYLALVVACFGAGSAVGRSAVVLGLVQAVGGGYLVYLGLRAAGVRPPWAGPKSVRAFGDERLFRQGFLIAITNPKTMFFLGSVFPEYLVSGAGDWAGPVVLAATVTACVGGGQLVYALFATGLGRWLARAEIARRIDQTAAGVYLLLGVAAIVAGLRRATA